MMGHSGQDWQPTRWWRVIYADGRTYPDDHQIRALAGQPQLWCETSDEDEAREALARCPGGGVLQRHYELRMSEWRDEHAAVVEP